MVEVGQNLGRYRIESPLGAGGMGEVFRAWDSTLRRWVALKVVARDSTGRAERLLAEARAVATLKHPNVVSVFDVGEVDGVAFVSMDLIVGKTLREYIGDDTVTSDTKQSWLLQIAGALSAAHRAGLVHRDTKPENVMIGEDGQAHVLDFGIAKSFGIDVVGPTQHSDETAAATAHLTGEGRIIGTPAYMAPEQLAGGPPSPLWDQYAFGVVAYELLTGKHPRIAGLIGPNGRVKPADEVAAVPPALAEVASHAMAPSPEQRYASMDDVVLALGGNVSGAVARIQSLPPPGASRPPPPLSTNTPLAKGIGVQDTLPTAVQMPHPPRAPMPAIVKNAGFVVLMLALLGGGVFVGSRWLGRTDAVPPPPSVTASAPASWTPPVASSAPPPPPSASVAPSVVASVAPPPVTTVKPPPPPPPAKPLDVYVRAGATLQYPLPVSARIVSIVQSQIRSCILQHPPATVPATIGIKLELWNIGDLEGKVRSVDAREPPALEACFRDALMPVSFGPGADPKLPPGAIFLTVEVRQP